MEYGTAGVNVMLFRQYHLLLGIGAANPGTVAVITLGNPSGPNALNPGDIFRMFLIRSSQDLTTIGAGGGQETFIVHTGDHVLHGWVGILILN